MVDQEEIERLLQTMSEVWGSEEQANIGLANQVAELNAIVFDGELPCVNVHVAPRSMLSGLFGADRNAAANYNPAYEDHAAYIFVGQSAIMSKDQARIILAHELVHHWEHTVSTDSDPSTYPNEIEMMIKHWFPDFKSEKKWRATHSNRFLAKAYLMSAEHGFELSRLLSGYKPAGALHLLT
jgi:hypothetical protein